MLLTELLKAIESFAPLGLALDWDNSGLQIGESTAEIHQALITLDVTSTAVDYAIQNGADLIISHHPLIFRAQKRITDPLWLRIIRHGIAVVSLHTNFDVAPGGVNHALAAALGFRVVEPISPQTGSVWHHLSLTVPAEHLNAVAAAAFSAGAGRIGAYEGCSTRHELTGTFTPLDTAKPYVGNPGQAEIVTEVEFECMVDDFRLNAVLSAIRKSHPYETPLLYHHPVANPNPAYALGLLCAPDVPLSLNDLAASVKTKLSAPYVRLWNAKPDAEHQITRIAVCGGAGGSLLPGLRGKADVLITGDINYHAMLESPVSIIDAGHFYTEYPALTVLRRHCSDLGLSADILPVEQHEFTRQHGLV